jgi:hypothetical protein
VLSDALQTTKEGAQYVYNALPDTIKGPIDSAIQSQGGQAAIGLAQKLGNIAEKTPEMLRSIPGEYLAEKVKWPLIGAALGAKVTVPLYIADKMLNPSGFLKYLANTDLPREAIRTAGREAASIPIRGFFEPSQEPWQPSKLGLDAMSGGRTDLADLMVKPGEPGTDQSQWDARVDGSKKGMGWLGLLRRPDGNVSSELSVGVEIDGKEREIPLLVPTLTRQEIDQVLSSDEPPRAALDKAVAFARQRIAKGQDPFASPSESPRYGR